MGIENLRDNKVILKVNQKCIDFLLDYVSRYECKEEVKMTLLKNIKDSKTMNSFYTAFLFTFSAFLFKKLKKNNAIVISSLLYLAELTIYKKSSKKNKTTVSKDVDSLKDLIESMCLNNEFISSSNKVKILKIIKQITQEKDAFFVSNDTFVNSSKMNKILRHNFIDPVSLILSLGEVFEPRTEEDLKYLNGYCVNVSKLIFILSANQKNKNKQISKYFTETEIRLFGEQADDFLEKFGEKTKFLKDFTKKLQHEINDYIIERKRKIA